MAIELKANKQQSLQVVQAAICGLLLNNDHYSDKTLSWVNKYFAAALKHRQIRFANHKGKIIGFVTWAYLNEMVEARLLAGDSDLQPDEWHCGDRLWIMDRLFTNKTVDAQLEHMEKEIFNGMNPLYIRDEISTSKIDFEAALGNYFRQDAELSGQKNAKNISMRFMKTREDVDAMLDLVDCYMAEQPRELFPSKRTDKEKILYGYMKMRPQQFAPIIAVHQNKVIGFLLGKIGKHNDMDVLAAQNVGFYVHPDFRGTRAAFMLLQAYKLWAKFAGARILIMSVMSGIEIANSDRFFKKAGFQCVGGNYQMLLAPTP